jgi:hypothetical protein
MKFDKNKLRKIQKSIDKNDRLIMQCLDKIEQNNIVILKAQKNIGAYNNLIKKIQRHIIELKRRRGDELPLLDKALLNKHKENI